MHIEEIRDGHQLLSLVVRPGRPDETRFLTTDDLNLQAGFVVRTAGEDVARHVHLPVERTVVGTTEVLLVRHGRCRLDVYDDNRTLIDSRELIEGDLCITIAGGHGLHMLEDTVLFEVKQGPYKGVEADKQQF